MRNYSNETVLGLTTDHITDEDDTLWTLLHITLQLVLFSVGLYINIKLICECKKDKGMTWQISATHSAVTTIYYGYFIPFQAVTHFVPFLAQYTGKWLCYTSSFIAFYFYHSILSHSLIISAMKYVFIVHALKARTYGDSTIKKYFFLFCIIMPLILTSIAMFTADMDARSSLRSCFGHTKESLYQNGTASSRILKFTKCNSIQREEYDVFWFYVLQCFCIFRSLFSGAIITNLLEGLLYYKIFHTMKG